jgi:hypothetical protein
MVDARRRCRVGQRRNKWRRCSQGGGTGRGGAPRRGARGRPRRGGWERVATEKMRVQVAVVASKILGSLTASARMLAQDLKFFSKSQSV